MKKITNWKKFNEDIYPGWTSTTTNNPKIKVEDPKQEAQPLPEKEFKLNLRCKIAVERSIDSSNCSDAFNYGNIDDIVSTLEKHGFSVDWFADEFRSFKNNDGPQDPGNEPDRSDFDEGENGDDDYNSELEEYENQKKEFDEWEDMDDSDALEKYIDILYNGNWDKFLDIFTETGSPYDVLSNRDRKDLFENLKELFNRYLFDNLKFGDVILRNVLENIQVVGDDFVDDYYELEITSNKEIDLDSYEDELLPALIDELIYGVGTKLDEKIDDVSVITWWNDANKDLGKFEILVAEFKTYEFQKKFISENPSEYERLEKYGYNKDIKKEYDHLFNAKDIGLI